MNDQTMAALPFINEAQIEAILEWRPLMNALEHAMIDFSAGNVVQPVRQLVPVPGHDAIIAAMPVVGEAMAVKVVTLYHENAGTDIPTRQASGLMGSDVN
jgi:ornithine cyclodeaminase/alanine dehydrogenase-like protein (mu-crystallin family)